MQLVAFIDVKRAAQKLGEKHLRQVETYAVKEGHEWLILTNGQTWQAYHVYAKTGQQVATHLALEVDILGEDPIGRKVDGLFFLQRIALKRGLIDGPRKRKAATLSLSDTELELDVQPLTRTPQPVACRAWVRYPEGPVKVDARAVAWAPQAVAIEWDAPGPTTHRAWVWASAVSGM